MQLPVTFLFIIAFSFATVGIVESTRACNPPVGNHQVIFLKEDLKGRSHTLVQFAGGGGGGRQK